MLWLYAEDEAYYSTGSIEELRENYKLQDIILFPSLSHIRDSVSAGKKVAFMAPCLPQSIDRMFEGSSFFEVIELKNKFGVLTTGQHNADISESIALKEKLGIQIHKSNLTLKDYGGASILLDEARKVSIKERYGLTIKGFMLAGMPGTGKSFFAKCMAGETGRLLVELNLSQIMERQDTIFRLNMIFEYFITHPGRYILWIDEIEKMLVGEKAIQVLGILLTRINDLNANGSKSDSSIFVIATANNISDIAGRFPEFLRYGRFDLLVFLQPPTEDNAARIFELYLGNAMDKFETETFLRLFQFAISGDFEDEGTLARKMQMKIVESVIDAARFENLEPEALITDEEFLAIRDRLTTESRFTFDVQSFIVKAMVEYNKHVSSNRFIYTPAEIEFIVNDVFFAHFFDIKKDEDGSYEDELHERLVRTYRPLQHTLKSSLDKMSGIASDFTKI